MFKREIVYRVHNRTGREWWCRVLDVQYVDRATSQLDSECQRNTHERSMWQRTSQVEIGPTIPETLDGFFLCYIQSVTVDSVDFGKCFN